ncbi:hypothetical protein [Xylophilus sp. Leaf220]|uniref:hypothetical protein n=1 Tax=Xylophilus sp. Leaf220 TaxID=1735686 RepID=UPI0012E325CC|nr:hypothetical protein [Xylophilus sp. Leaf220]
MTKIVSCICAIFIVGCDVASIENEAINKSEYSLLQYYAYEFQQAKHDRPYMIFKKALNTDINVIAFPAANKNNGYVAIIAKSAGYPRVKILPEEEFIINKKSYEELKSEISISREVNFFIQSKIK